MVLGELTDRNAVLQAIDECDRIGRQAFLAKHGYHPAKGYWLVHRGRSYDSKAITGVAYGYQHPNRGVNRNLLVW
ncbi:MAG: hypothetical protein QGI24_09310, partial [Kiritimatiellia bacterium]|nr:hypothetical protein [Kiritimatiellia bacterium]